MTTWRVDAAVVHPRFGEFVFLSSWDDQFVLNNSRVDVSNRTVNLRVYVSGGSRDQALHRAGREFHSIVWGLNLGGDSLIAQIREEPVEVPADEAVPGYTVDCPEDEKESTINILLVNHVVDRAAPAIAVEDVQKWMELYEMADAKNRRRIKDLVRGSFLMAYDREMGNFYGYKVLDTMLDDEFRHLRERDRFSRGKTKHHLRGLRGSFTELDSGIPEEVQDAMDTFEGHLSKFEEFSNEDLLHEMAEETGFYDEIEENAAASMKAHLMGMKAHGDETVIAAYRGNEEAIQALKSNESRDYEALMARMEGIEQEAVEEAAEHAMEHVKAWEDRFRKAQRARGRRIAHGLLSEQPDETAELDKEFSGMIALGKHLVEKSIKGEI